MLHAVHRRQPHWTTRAVGQTLRCVVEREVGGLGRRVSQDPFGLLWEKVVGKVGKLRLSVIVPSPYLGLDGGRNSAPLAA